jgi:hypothetical protein
VTATPGCRLVKYPAYGLSTRPDPIGRSTPVRAKSAIPLQGHIRLAAGRPREAGLDPPLSAACAGEAPCRPHLGLQPQTQHYDTKHAENSQQPEDEHQRRRCSQNHAEDQSGHH